MYDRFAGGRERALRTLERAFRDPGNSAAAEVVWVAELDGRLGAAMAAYPVEEALVRSRALLGLALRGSPFWRWPGALRLYWLSGRASPSPPTAAFYIDALATDSRLRRRGLASALLAEAERQARLAMAEPAAEAEGAMALAQVHVRRSEVPQALAVLESARERAIQQKCAPAAGLNQLRADVLARLGRFADAEAVLRDEIRSAPGRAQAYASLAVLVALQGRPRHEVHEILDSMVKANPARDTVLLAAKTLDFLGDKDAARAWRKRAS
jgi:GNAT superfamily N-acetyltransferase